VQACQRAEGQVNVWIYAAAGSTWQQDLSTWQQDLSTRQQDLRGSRIYLRGSRIYVAAGSTRQQDLSTRQQDLRGSRIYLRGSRIYVAAGSIYAAAGWRAPNCISALLAASKRLVTCCQLTAHSTGCCSTTCGQELTVSRSWYSCVVDFGLCCADQDPIPQLKSGSVY
jgi:hypothetical protein